MKKKLIIFGVIVAVIVAAAIAYVYGMSKQVYDCCHGEQYSMGPIESWKAYRNEKLGFELKYPPTWKVLHEDSEKVLLTDSAGGDIRILPQGEPKDGRREPFVPSDIVFSEPVSTKIDFVTTEQERYATYVRIDHGGKDTWDESGMIEANTALEGSARHCLRDGKEIEINRCDVIDGDLMVYSGKVNRAQREVVKRILSTFRFIAASSTKTD